MQNRQTPGPQELTRTCLKGDNSCSSVGSFGAGNAPGWGYSPSHTVCSCRQVSHFGPSYFRLRCRISLQCASDEVANWLGTILHEGGYIPGDPWNPTEQQAPDEFGIIWGPGEKEVIDFGGNRSTVNIWLCSEIYRSRTSRVFFATFTEDEGFRVLCASYLSARGYEESRLHVRVSGSTQSYIRCSYVVEREFIYIAGVQSTAALHLWTAEHPEDLISQIVRGFSDDVFHANVRRFSRLLFGPGLRSGCSGGIQGSKANLFFERVYSGWEDVYQKERLSGFEGKKYTSYLFEQLPTGRSISSEVEHFLECFPEQDKNSGSVDRVAFGSGQHKDLASARKAVNTAPSSKGKSKRNKSAISNIKSGKSRCLSPRSPRRQSGTTYSGLGLSAGDEINLKSADNLIQALPLPITASGPSPAGNESIAQTDLPAGDSWQRCRNKSCVKYAFKGGLQGFCDDCKPRNLISAFFKSRDSDF